jgi:hypothetical protein
LLMILLSSDSFLNSELLGFYWSVHEFVLFHLCKKNINKNFSA